jgi:peptide chain release factor 2
VRIDTFRSGGAGGQSVNTTDSAVRLTHIPTGVVVTCQAERSQHQNKRTAFSLLTSRLLALEEQAAAEAKAKLRAAQGKNAWGEQIRSTVLHPYTLVKDARSGVESHNTLAYLAGDIEPFVRSALELDL